MQKKILKFLLIFVIIQMATIGCLHESESNDVPPEVCPMVYPSPCEPISHFETKIRFDFQFDIPEYLLVVGYREYGPVAFCGEVNPRSEDFPQFLPQKSIAYGRDPNAAITRHHQNSFTLTSQASYYQLHLEVFASNERCTDVLPRDPYGEVVEIEAPRLFHYTTGDIDYHLNSIGVYVGFKTITIAAPEEETQRDPSLMN